VRPIAPIPSEVRALWHPDLTWHWGNIGSFLAGLSTVAIAVGALIRGPAVVPSGLDRLANGEAIAVLATVGLLPLDAG
jgi:hypothetical protein